MKYTFFLPVSSILDKFSRYFLDSGYEIFLVGGCIRDMVCNRPVVDYDFASNAFPADIQNIFSKTVPTGIEHGTVTVLFEGNEFQVTTYRTEGTYSNSRKPDQVSFSNNIFEDLSRRDFTINAMAYNPISCMLIDEFDGIQDIEKKIVRCVGDPQKRFEEDALRMLRACRFACQLEFSIENSTFLAIQNLCKNIKKISAERIRDEWIKILLSKNPSLGISILKESGLLKEVIPQLEETIGITQNKYHKYDVYMHSLKTLEAIKSTNYRIRMAGLLHDIAKPQTKEYHKIKKDYTFYAHESIGANMVRNLMKDMKFPNEDIYFVSHLVRHHMFHYTSEWTDGAVRKFISRVGLEYLDPLFDLRQADRIATGLLDKDDPDILLEELRTRINEVLEKCNVLCIANLDINGNDIMSHCKVPPGKHIGGTLQYLLDRVQENPSYNKKEILQELSKEYLKNILF